MTIGSSTALGYQLGLPIRDALVERVSRRRRAVAAAREVLHPRFDPRGPHRQHEAARVRAWTTTPTCSTTRVRRSGCVPDAELKGVKPIAWYDGADAAAQRLGVGPAVSRSGRVDHRSTCRQGPCRVVRQRGELARISRTARSSCCSTASTTARRRRRPQARGLPIGPESDQATRTQVACVRVCFYVTKSGPLFARPGLLWLARSIRNVSGPRATAPSA